MNFKRDSICIGLIGCMLLIPINDVAAYPQTATQSNLNSVKQQVEQIGVGAEVKLKLAGGEKLRGDIQAIDDQGFVLDSGQQASHRRLTYDQVARVMLASLVYRATGVPDPIAAGRVVAGLGVGHHIVVKTCGSPKRCALHIRRFLSPWRKIFGLELQADSWNRRKMVAENVGPDKRCVLAMI
jgi:hypothetical protein